MGAATNRLLGFDALRGVAALVVLFYHIQMRYKTGSVWTMGALAVDLFFLLSGYVMARTYEARMAGGLGFGSFMAARYRRLWLPYAIGLTIGLAWWLTDSRSPELGLGAGLVSLAFGLVFLPTPMMGRNIFALNTPGWSLFFELAANALHALVFARLGNRALGALLAALAVLFWFMSLDAGWLLAGTKLDFWPFAAVRTLVPYIIGILLWRLARDKGPQLPWWATLVALPLVILAGKQAPQPLFQVLFVLLICPLLVWCALRFQAGPVVSRVASALGTLSYPLYAVHMPVLYFCQRAGWPWQATLAATLVAGTATALLVTRLPAGWPFVRSPRLPN